MSKNLMQTTRRPRIVAATALAATALLGGSAYASGLATDGPANVSGAVSSAPEKVHLKLKPSTPELADCLPYAQANVTVALTTEQRGKDTFRIAASGLKPKTAFTVFLLEKAGAPFGSAEYIGDFDTNRPPYRAVSPERSVPVPPVAASSRVDEA